MSDLTNTGLINYYEALDGESSLTSNVWHTNIQKRHAFKIYSDLDTVANGVLIPEQAEATTKVITTFSDLETTLNNTEIVQLPDGNEVVELDLEDRVLTLLLDQSGSMTWNDNEGLRHTVARRLVERSSATYPGEINYNVVKFGGTPVNVTLFGVVENNRLQDTTLSGIQSSFFQDDVSNFAGTRIVRKEGSYPNHALDGDIVQEGFFSKSLDDELTEGTEYFYKVFTFDKNFHFSEGIPIKATPRERDIPRGVQSVDFNIINGTGLVRDDNTIGIWHFDEATSNSVYDFSNNKNNLVIEPSFVWLGSDEVPIGTSGIRLDGNSTEASVVESDLKSTVKMTFMAWVYPYSLSNSGGIISRNTGTDTDYAVFQTNTGQVGFSADGSSVVSTTNPVLVAEEWNHVAVVVNGTSVSFYINGVFIETKTFSLAGRVSSDNMNFRIGNFDQLSIGNFFGKITEVSVHNTNRSASYISENSISTSLEFSLNDTIQDQEDFGDNGDRLVIIRYDVPKDFNYNKIKFLRKEFSAPSWEEDGTTFEEISVNSSGRFITTDVIDFVLGETYYYRIFTQNDLGNYSYQEDSPVLEVEIENLGSDPDILSSPIFSPSNPQVQVGNEKLYLTWDNFVLDARIARVEVYVSQNGFPTIEEGNRSSGELVFSGTSNSTGFVHRGLENAKGYFYTIVNKDRLGRYSNPVNISEKPSSGEDETGIPRLEVENIHYEIVDNQSLSLKWDEPFGFKSDLEGFLDQRVLIYGAITDEFGSPISDDTEISMDISANISEKDIAENIFGRISEELSQADIAKFTPEDFYTFSVSREPNGIIKGTLSMTSSSAILSFLESAEFSITVTSKIPDPDRPSSNLFEFYSAPVSIRLKNPWLMELSNRDKRTISRLCPVSLDGLSTPTLLQDTPLAFEEKTADGAYVRSTSPFVVRVNLSFRDEPLVAGSNIIVSVWDANDNICGDEFIPRPIRPSTTVIPPATTLEVQIEEIEELDENGEPTGRLFEQSYVDVAMTVPSLPQGALLYVQSDYGGYVTTQSFHMVMENILNIELTARAPIADGIDIAEQQATVWIRDPDFPSDVSKRTTVPDGTLVRWNLRKKEFAKDRPFYSTEILDNTIGVVSTVQNGQARNVFFGPAANAQWNVLPSPTGGVGSITGERYSVFASVLWDDLADDDEQDVEIYPLGSGNKFKTKMLMEMPSFKNVLWADGEDYVRMVISRDLSNPSFLSKYGGCVQKCVLSEAGDLIAMNPGQNIYITADETTEIIWGNIIEDIDPYTGVNVLDMLPGSFSKKQSALVEIVDDDETFVYFRINKFIEPAFCPCEDDSTTLGVSSQLLNDCECLGIEKDCPISSSLCEEVIVNGSTSILLNQKPRLLTGGGGMSDGLPPTILVPKEPLQIKIVDILADGVSSSNIVIDGSTKNTIVADVSFSERPVPDGTPVKIDFASNLEGGASVISLSKKTIYTNQEIRTGIDSLNVRSYATIELPPISPESPVFEQLIFETNYNKVGDVEREAFACATIDWDPASQQADVDANNIFNDKIYAYDINGNTWNEDLNRMNSPRGHLSLETYNEDIFAIGGISANTISSINEKYSVANDEWEEVSAMPTARFAAQSVAISNKIYVLGGISSNSSGNELQVSQACEVYDASTDEWEVLADMPNVDIGTVDGEPNGVAFGVAHYLSIGGEDRIYVVSGVKSINQSGQINKINNRVLYYKIATDQWVNEGEYSGFELEIFKRTAPFSYTIGNSIHVVGGAITTNDISDNALEFLTDAYVYNASLSTIDIDDARYSVLPEPRYQGTSVTYSGDHYLLGGSNASSQTLNIHDKLIDDNPFDYSSLANLPVPLTGTSSVQTTSVSAPYSSNPFIFVAGGFTSGREAGFLQIQATFSPTKMDLNGRQSIAVHVALKDQNGDPPIGNVTVQAKGFLKFKTSVPNESNEEIIEELLEQQSDAAQREAASIMDDRLAIYPVLFTRQDLTTENGRGTITLLPRSDDNLEGIEELATRAGFDSVSQVNLEAGEGLLDSDALVVIRSGQIREPYAILVQLTVVDDFYFGQTIENLDSLTGGSVGDLLNEGVVTDGPETEGSSGGSELCKGNIFVPNTSVVWAGVSRGINIGSLPNLQKQLKGFTDEESNLFFSLIPKAFGQLNSPLIGTVADIDYVPSITSVLNTSDATESATLNALRNIENEVPFGSSAVFDALVAASSFLSKNSLDSKGKVNYLFTDNESNLSRNTIEQTIEELNAIDGTGKVSTIIGNFSVVSPITLSARANITDTANLNRLFRETAGQSLTVLSASFVDEIVQIFTGEATGSLGYGTAEIVIDLEQISAISNITTLFQLFENTNGEWSIEVSNDGYNYTNITDEYKSNEIIAFENLTARYIRLSVILITGFTASNMAVYETIALAESPSLTSIEITYDLIKQNQIYLNTELDATSSLQQIVAAVDATKVDPSDIQVGVAKSSSHNWLDFHSHSQPFIPQNGKIFVPIRVADLVDDVPREPLVKLDSYAFRAENARWDPKSIISVYDTDGNLIPSVDYKVYPREGMIVFNQRRAGSYFVTISDQSKFRLGLNLISRSSTNPLWIYGLGFMYNTNVQLLPPAQNIAPVANNVLIVPGEINPYTKITASFEYEDVNETPESVEDREIKWYINGVRIPYLDNLTVWNNIEDINDVIYQESLSFRPSDLSINDSVISAARRNGESILKANDTLYFTVRVSDGELTSERTQSQVVNVGEFPPTAESVVLRSVDSNNRLLKNITSENAVVVQFSLLSDTATNRSRITWFVNGVQFKTGVFGANDGSDRILPGELDVDGVLALQIGNEIFAQVQPETEGATGETQTSDSVVVANALPTITTAVLGPTNPRSAQNIVLSFSFSDYDIDINGDVTQSNNSTVKWFRSAGNNNFLEVAELANESIVPAAFTNRNERWYAEVTPNDGIDSGSTVRTNTVTIL